MPAPDIVAAVESLEPASYTGPAYRHIAENRNSLSGEGARTLGGRWNPPDSFSTLYLALERSAAVAEFVRMARRLGREPADFLPRRLYSYEVSLAGIIDMRSSAAQETVNLSEPELRGDDLSPCQQVGEAAHLLGHEGVIAPSAAGPGTVIAVFFDRLQSDSSVIPVEYEIWSA